MPSLLFKTQYTCFGANNFQKKEKCHFSNVYNVRPREGESPHSMNAMPVENVLVSSHLHMYLLSLPKLVIIGFLTKKRLPTTASGGE